MCPPMRQGKTTAVIDDLETDLSTMSPQHHHPLVCFGMTDAVAEGLLGNRQHLCPLFWREPQADLLINRDDNLSSAGGHEGPGQRTKRIADSLVQDNGRLHVRNKRP